MCNCITELRDNLKLEENVLCIVADQDYTPKFLPKGTVSQTSQKCSTVTVQGTKKLSTVLEWDLTVGKWGVLTGTSINLAKCAGCRDIVMIWGINYHILSSDPATGEVTGEVVGDVPFAGTVPGGTEVCLIGDAGEFCDFDPNCTTFDIACHDVILQKFEDCWKSCLDTQVLALAGGLGSSIDEDMDNARAMFKKHLTKLDRSMFFGVPSKDLSKGTYNYASAGYAYYAHTFGKVSDFTGMEFTKDLIDLRCCDLDEEEIEGDCVYMHPKTWLAFQKVRQKGCYETGSDIRGTRDNKLGHTNKYIILDCIDNDIEVRTWNKIPQGRAYLVNSQNFEFKTLPYLDGSNFIAKLVNVKDCGGGNKKYEYESQLGLKVFNPMKTAVFLFDMPTMATKRKA